MRKHGKCGSLAYKSWSYMKTRCFNVNYRKFENYGGRGITVCERWLKFENFYADMGDRPEGLTLDRKDNDGNYEPSNCRWASASQQGRNQRLRSINKTGITGVFWVKVTKKWRAAIRVDTKLRNLYYGNDFFEACCRRKSAELAYW